MKEQPPTPTAAFVRASASSPPHPRPASAAEVHEKHAEFVWRSLHRMGVASQDLEDQLQEVFLVVHRNLTRFDGSSRLTTWLFGICLRVASDYRKRAYRRRETSFDGTFPEEPATTELSPEERTERRQAAALLEATLERLDAEQRALFVFFEIDRVPCAELAELLGIPLGTVYSRLHTARAAFARALEDVRKEGAKR